ncbi:ParB N-terminal domain-containing protein [Ferrovibrio sp.]|uniref:ParB N-terminal domain-containing protein n=1 Tax=Ferrovibrio sp. TaxID=1917215 RepID=UPI003D268BC5
MMKPVPIPLAKIYIPQKFKGTLEQAKMEALADDIVQNGLQIPIQVRVDKDRYVLVAGLHRLEAFRFLGEAAIPALVVAARKF